MSIVSIRDIAKSGLHEEDLNRIIKIENLKDVSQKFSDQIRTITDAFGSAVGMRIIAFNETSGIDSTSKMFFRELISGGRDVLYYCNLSNKECCVVLIYNSKGETLLKSFKHLLCHEFAHHFQFAFGGFPGYIPKARPQPWVPPFVTPYEVGPEVGSARIDRLPLTDLPPVIQDSNERISDTISEGLLREKGLILDFLEYFKNNVALREDPADTIPAGIRHPHLKRYVRRLALRDNAEWGATIQLAYPRNNNAKKVISQGRKFAIKLNKKYPRAAQAHDEIFELCVNTDFRLFRTPANVVSFTKKVMDLLNIEIETTEKW